MFPVPVLLALVLLSQMYRSPVRHQRSPGAPRPPGRFPSPAQGWSYPGTRSPYAGSPPFSPGFSPGFSPCPPRFSSGPQRFSPGSNRGFEGQTRNQGFGFRRPRSFSPTSSPHQQVPGLGLCFRLSFLIESLFQELLFSKAGVPKLFPARAT